MEFDPTTAKEAYSELSTDELVRIACLDDRYVADARQLASEELARRKISVDQRMLEQVRGRLNRQRADIAERDMSTLEAESDMPSWRRSARRRLAPYRTPLTVLTLIVWAMVQLDSIREWGLFGLDPRKSNALLILAMLIWLVFLLPSREEAERQARKDDV